MWSLTREMVKRVHVWITGKVQGVFFRDLIKTKAKEMGLVGWVKNNEDGSVEAVFEGAETELKQMTELCEKGSQSARVEKVIVEDEDDTVGYSSFEVKF